MKEKRINDVVDFLTSDDCTIKLCVSVEGVGNWELKESQLKSLLTAFSSDELLTDYQLHKALLRHCAGNI